MSRDGGFAGNRPAAAEDDGADRSGHAIDPDRFAIRPAACAKPSPPVGADSTVSLPQTFTENGDIVEVPEEVKRAVQDHKFTAGWGGKRSGKDFMQASFIHQWGVYQERTVEKGASSSYTEHEWRCKAGERCRSARVTVRCKDGNTGNVNKHLKKEHGICASPNKSSTANRKQVVDLAAHAGAQKIAKGVSSVRANEIAFTRLLVKKMLPFSLPTSPEFRMLMSLASNHTFPTMGARYVKHTVLEMYDATKKAMMEGLESEQKRVCLKNLHFCLNIWTCNVSGKKFLGVHIFWVDEEFKLRSACIAVKHYRPAPTTDTQKASESLWKILKTCVAEFGLDVAQFASCTTNAGPDVECMAVKLAGPSGILWKWCDAHLVGEACEVAFGTRTGPQTTKSRACRDIISEVVEVVRTMKSSKTTRARFEDIEVEELGSILEMAEHDPQSWLGLVKALLRIILLWPLLRLTFAKENEPFPLDAVMNETLELYSLLAPCAKIIRQALFGAKAVAGKTHSLIGLVIAKTLNPGKPLKVYMLPAEQQGSDEETRDGVEEKGEPIDCQVEQDQGGKRGQPEGQDKELLPSRDVPHQDLSEVARETRMALRAALIGRYAGRVWDRDTPDPPFFDDAQVFLTPSYSSSTFLNNFKLRAEDQTALPAESSVILPTSSDDVKERGRQAWNEIEARAVQAATKEAERNAESWPSASSLFAAGGGEGPGSSCRKRRRLDDDDDEELAGMFSDASEANDGDATVIVDLVKAEIKRYKSVRIDPRDMLLQDGLDYWAKDGRRAFSILRHVARQVFGMQASAARIEHDFSGAGQLLSGRRSRLDTHWVEMLLFLHASFDRIPAYIPAIPRGKIRDCLPTHFRELDSELVLAENVIDPVETSADAFIDPCYGLPGGEDDNG
ncbi:unnamed protein product [Scytosiphon promiscuus]